MSASAPDICIITSQKMTTYVTKMTTKTKPIDKKFSIL